MAADLDAIQARYDAWADPPVDPGDLDDTEIHALWKSANDVPRLLAEVERQGRIIQDLKVSESRAKALSVQQEVELRAARAAREAYKLARGDTEGMCSTCWEEDYSEAGRPCDCDCHDKEAAMVAAFTAWDEVAGEVGGRG